MPDLGPHAAFIVISYAGAFFVISGLALWAWRDERGQRRKLAELERRGMRRRSGSAETAQ